MSSPESDQSSPYASLFESAIAVASPGHATKLRKGIDPNQTERFSPGHPDAYPANPILGSVQWTPALRAAFDDGYDPILWLGRGAFAEVWRCVDRSFGREVAIKALCFDSDVSDHDAVAALIEEAELLGRLQHPGIVHTIRLSGQGRSTYLALDFVDGDNIVRHCTSGKLDLKKRLSLFMKALDAVAYLHDKELIHGDLKSEHIIVREDQQPVIIDFGLSTFDSNSSIRLSDDRRVGGSGEYRAPEIVARAATKPSPEQDVYSLGVLLEKLLEDLPLGPFEDRIAKLIERATAEDASERWPNAGEMLKELRSILAPPPRQPGPASEEPKPKKWHKGLQFVLIPAALLSVLAGVLWMNPAENDQPGDHPAAPNQGLNAQANLFGMALSDIYAGNNEDAQEHIDTLISMRDDQPQSWEARHLNAMLGGGGEHHPFGPNPYDTVSALSLDFDARSQTIAYSRRGHGSFELLLRSKDEQPTLLYATAEVIRTVAISPGADRIATIEQSGKLTIFSIPGGDLGQATSHGLPITIDARHAWFSADARSLYLFSPGSRTIERWAADDPGAVGPANVITECDHVYPLHSAKGSFLVATAGANTEAGLTRLRQFDPSDAVTRTIDLPDAQVPTSADAHAGEDAVVCLGMPNGYVRIYDPRNGGWQKPCDFDDNKPVVAVVYSAAEQRAFAVMERVHVVDPAGELVGLLGDRDAPTQLIRDMTFDEPTGTLTCLSLRDVWQCTAPRKTN